MIPLKRHNSVDLVLESTMRSPVATYAAWLLQFVFLSHKLLSFHLRSAASETLEYYILHAIMLIQIVGGVLATASIVVKSAEAKSYFNLLHLHLEKVRRK